MNRNIDLMRKMHDRQSRVVECLKHGPIPTGVLMASVGMTKGQWNVDREYLKRAGVVKLIKVRHPTRLLSKVDAVAWTGKPLGPPPVEVDVVADAVTSIEGLLQSGAMTTRELCHRLSDMPASRVEAAAARGRREGKLVWCWITRGGRLVSGWRHRDRPEDETPNADVALPTAGVGRGAGLEAKNRELSASLHRSARRILDALLEQGGTGGRTELIARLGLKKNAWTLATNRLVEMGCLTRKHLKSQGIRGGCQSMVTLTGKPLPSLDAWIGQRRSQRDRYVSSNLTFLPTPDHIKAECEAIKREELERRREPSRPRLSDIDRYRAEWRAINRSDIDRYRAEWRAINRRKAS